MAFGNELKDFVAGFQTGYNMFKSKDEKEWEREKRQMERDKHSWGREDRDFRREQFDYGKERDTVGDSQWERQFEESNRRYGRTEDRLDRQYEADERQRGVQTEFGVQDRDYRERVYRDSQREKLTGGGLNTEDQRRANDFGDWYDPRRQPAMEGDTAPSSTLGNQSVRPMSYQGEAIPAEPAAYFPSGGQSPEAAANTAFNLNSYLRSIRRAESGGNDRAKNPSSTATGRYQFLKGTWNNLARQNPDLKLSSDGRFDPEQNERAIRRFTYNNGKVLQRAGVPVTNGTMYAAHFLGADGATKVLRSRPDASVSSIVSADVVKANPFLKGMTVSDFRRWAERKANSDSRRRRTVNAAAGGMIEALPMEDDDAPDFVMPDEPEMALPEEGPVPSPRYEGVEEAPASDEPEPPTDDPWEAGRRAVRDGLKRALQITGADADSAIDTPELERARTNYLRGYGAAPKQMMKQAQDMVDPNRELPPSQRNLMAIGTVYQFFVDKGEYDKAQEAAASMVQAQRVEAQKFFSIGQAAAQKGDLDVAAKAFVAAYANIPNGRDLKIVPNEDGSFAVTVTDERSGEVINRRIVPPKEVGALAMNMTPAMFEEELLAAAGAPPVETKQISRSELGDTAAEADAAIETIFAETDTFNPKELKGIRDTAVDFSKIEENGLDPERAVRLVAELLEPERDAETGEIISYKPGYKADKVPNSNMWDITWQDQKYRIPAGAKRSLDSLRSKYVGDLEKEAKRVEESGKTRSEAIDKIGKGIGLFGSALGRSEGVDNEALPTDQRQLPMTQPFRSPFAQEEPDDPSWVPQPDRVPFVR